jgi:radical SAM protein with 4Fe4S-binding SPASM domain
MCPIEDLKAKKEKLTLDKFKHIISQFPFLRIIRLYGIGEPLNNPRIAEMVKICKSKNIYTEFVTNGTLLNEKRSGELIDSGLDKLLISLDSIHPENYESVRKGAKFRKVIENVKGFIHKRKSLGKSQPSVGVVVVLMNRNKQELAEIIDFVYHLGVDSILIKGLNTAYLEQPGNLQYDGEEFEEVFSLREDFKSKGFDIQLSAPHKKKEERCHWPWTSVFLTVNGDITPCCNCPDSAKLSFGNIFQQPFLEIWNSRKYRDFRSTFRKEMPAICRSCPDYSFDYLARERQINTTVFDVHNEISYLAFTEAKDFYKLGSTIRINLNDFSHSVLTEKVDLWIVIYQPNGEWVFLVNNNMFSLQPQPFKNGLKREEKTHRIVMQIPPSAMTGKYVLCAIYHKEKMAFSTLPINLRSNIAKQTVTLL